MRLLHNIEICQLNNVNAPSVSLWESEVKFLFKCRHCGAASTLRYSTQEVLAYDTWPNSMATTSSLQHNFISQNPQFRMHPNTSVGFS